MLANKKDTLLIRLNQNNIIACDVSQTDDYHFRPLSGYTQETAGSCKAVYDISFTGYCDSMECRLVLLNVFLPARTRASVDDACTIYVRRFRLSSSNQADLCTTLLNSLRRTSANKDQTPPPSSHFHDGPYLLSRTH